MIIDVLLAMSTDNKCIIAYAETITNTRYDNCFCARLRLLHHQFVLEELYVIALF